MSATSHPDPVEQYTQHSDIYDEIGRKVDRTHEAFLSADRPVQRMVLHQANTFALLSTQTAVPQHEAGYLNVMELSEFDQETVSEVLLDGGVNYRNNKARYIVTNLREANADRVIDHIEANEPAKALHANQDEFLGVAMAKSAYALAKLGVPEMACIDTHIGSFLGLDSDDVYDGVKPEKYLDQVEVLDQHEIAEYIPNQSRFMTQWVCFDTMRGGVTTHDAWFLSLPESFGLTEV